MKTARFLFSILIIAAASMIFTVSCQKDLATNDNAPAGKQSISVYLNDDPDVNFTKVLIDLRAVEVKIDTVGRRSDDDYDDDKDEDDDHHDHDNFGKWDTLNVKAGIYDLLRLRNGIDTVIANGFAVKGKIIKVRITLGSNNSVWTDNNKSFPLPMCDKNSPYLYVRIKSNLIDNTSGGGIRINLDFDVSKSINSKRSGTEFCLRPVLKAYSHGNSGEIEGKVLPAAAKARVMIFNAKDTAFAIPDYDDEGEYKVKGLNAGTYSVLFDGIDPYKDTTIQNIVVRKSEDTKVPTVTLHK
jgi:Domain of unknown function (DUF4382)